MYKRILDLNSALKKKSHFLFGARSTGKTSLIHQQLKNCVYIDLLNSDLYLTLSSHPSSLMEIIDAQSKKSSHPTPIVIDEVQKIPLLLDEIHRLIENQKLKFLLTGSSARKLKRGQANLLAGRAWSLELFPLTSAEITDFDLNKYLHIGGLPHVYTSEYPEQELNAYVKTYLNEEIQAEGIVRKLPFFHRFLLSAALNSGGILNYTKIGQDSQVHPNTVKEFYQVLEDTLIGFNLEPFKKTKKRKGISTSKFYFFDIGVTNALTRTKTVERNSDLYGKRFEQFIGMEIRAALSYLGQNDPLCFWRSQNDQEVDFIIDDHTAIEVKSSQKIINDDFTGLKALAEEKLMKKLYLVSQDKVEKITSGIHCLHWTTFLKKLWSGGL